MKRAMSKIIVEDADRKDIVLGKVMLWNKVLEVVFVCSGIE